MRDFSVALTSALHADLARHLVRADGDEDLTFLVWRPSAGATRDSAILVEAVMPNDGERHVHGNVSFESSYFLRACNRAADLGGGVALIHSHPRARHWPGLSHDDYVAESGHAAQALQLTGHPLVGLTLAGATRHYSARRWDRTAPREWCPRWADRVRVVGDQMMVSLPEGPAQHSARYQRRTIDTWGADIQKVIGSLNIGVVGAGSVGSQIIEALVRTGIGNLLILDYDTVEDHNLDRIINATVDDAGRALSKAGVAATAARAHATHHDIEVIVSQGTGKVAFQQVNAHVIARSEWRE
ncbi:MAG TPA: ThiF family adenylyltransferase [Acidimicrobiales bacterium]|nr:ThiF family adenylyltransferase [Acidimicrobiales bacterium]